jgi:hypothetical protein
LDTASYDRITVGGVFDQGGIPIDGRATDSGLR